MNTNFIGLDKEKSDKTVEKLNLLLSNFQVFYQNIKVLHWNIEGKNFFELHEVYGEYYETAAAHIDLIAERVLMLGGRPIGKFSEYLEKSNISEVEDIKNDREGVSLLMSNIGELVKLEREILAMTDGTDEGTFSIMSNISGCHEKNMWMLNAYLS